MSFLISRALTRYWRAFAAASSMSRLDRVFASSLVVTRDAAAMARLVAERTRCASLEVVKFCCKNTKTSRGTALDLAMRCPFCNRSDAAIIQEPSYNEALQCHSCGDVGISADYTAKLDQLTPEGRDRILTQARKLTMPGARPFIDGFCF